MQDVISALLDQIILEGKKQGLEQKDIARKAGISQETLSRAKKASDIQLSTLIRLANAVGLKVALSPAAPVLEKILSGDVLREDRP
ncbi:helix-turn-helix protein [bacterium BMS3Bbin06]|nr:helix-turn-helix protein [bacterium BMS3Abin08]GBE35772.1 helix-turn-helix protein [bacterium BMS3Bbin06]HDO34727.1 XRE family transcriptional regulator [Nitrospirota bacterium]